MKSCKLEDFSVTNDVAEKILSENKEMSILFDLGEHGKVLVWTPYIPLQIISSYDQK